MDDKSTLCNSGSIADSITNQSAIRNPQSAIRLDTRIRNTIRHQRPRRAEGTADMRTPFADRLRTTRTRLVPESRTTGKSRTRRPRASRRAGGDRRSGMEWSWDSTGNATHTDGRLHVGASETARDRDRCDREVLNPRWAIGAGGWYHRVQAAATTRPWDAVMSESRESGGTGRRAGLRIR